MKITKLNLIPIFTLIFCLFPIQTNADTTSITYIQTATDIWWGSFSWSNLNNIIWDISTSSATSTITTRNAYSNYISLTNFNLSSAWLPANAEITGIQVEVERDVSNTRMRDTTVQLTKDWTNLIWDNYWNNSNWPTTKTITTYGSSSDLWWTTWTTADLLSPDFWVILQYRYRRNWSADVNIYRVRVTVDYTQITETLTWDTLDFESSEWYTVTDWTWTRTTNNPYEWLYSIESWNNTDNSTSCFNVTKNITEDSTINFYKEVSSESWYDFLRFYINGSQQWEWSWENSWSQESYNTYSWFNTFRWCYEKDWSVSNWSDTAWIDYIEIKWTTTPWGVSNWLQIWLKADAGTSTTNNWSSLTSWNDQSWNWYNAWWGVSPTYLNNGNDNLNFNPVVDFNWTNQYLENLDNWAYTHSYFAVLIPDNQIDWTISWQVPFGFDCDSWVLSNWTCGLTFAWTVLWAFTAAINDEVITHAIGSSTNWRSSEIWTSSYEINKPILVHINENSSWDWTEIFEKWILKNNYNINTYQTISTSDYRIWMSSDSSYPFPYDWKIAEIINYSSRTSPIDKQKIESYLSLKYWITINNWTTNYIASDWTTNIWDNSEAWLYIYDIFWMWRDDNSELSQIKSKSINNDNIITIEAIWEWTNMAPSFIDINDKEFLTISNNDWWNTWSAIDAPTWYFILDRKWKVQETWEVWNINLSLNVANTYFDIPDLSVWTNYYFIYDSNNDSSLTDETPITMNNTLWNIWDISWNINNNTIFTLASESSTNNIPTDISISNDTINENVSSWTIVWNLSTTDIDTSDTHTYTFVSWTWDDDNSLFSIVWSALSINVSPDYEIKPYFYIRIQTDDWNWWQYQKAFTININNTWETITSLINFEQEINSYKYSVTSWSWTRNTINPNEWSYSFESNNSWDSTQSCFEVTHTFSWIWTINFDYEVSSETNSDYLNFYIDNIEQDSWSWNISWSTYTDNSIDTWTHIYKWCYIKDNSWASWTDNSYVDYISFTNWSIDTTPPTINSINYLSWTLLPWWNHNIVINYSDLESWINTSSDSIALNKWNWGSWWGNISATWLNLLSKTITATTATYPTNNLEYWKYRYNFQISDNSWNPTSISSIFYIDEPELIIWDSNIDIWNLQTNNDTFSSDLTITVKTIWAWFDLVLNKWTDLSYNWIQIQDWNWINWFWYDQEPYTSNIEFINNNEIIASQAWNINTSGEYNTYIYRIKLGVNAEEEQAAWEYIWDIDFRIDLDY